MAVTYDYKVSIVYIKQFHLKLEISKWCNENLGLYNYRWKITQYQNGCINYCFIHERDAVLFALKWS
jgi:hypothetical protein